MTTSYFQNVEQRYLQEKKTIDAKSAKSKEKSKKDNVNEEEDVTSAVKDPKFGIGNMKDGKDWKSMCDRATRAISGNKKSLTEADELEGSPVTDKILGDQQGKEVLDDASTDSVDTPVDSIEDKPMAPIDDIAGTTNELDDILSNKKAEYTIEQGKKALNYLYKVILGEYVRNPDGQSFRAIAEQLKKVVMILKGS